MTAEDRPEPVHEDVREDGNRAGLVVATVPAALLVLFGLVFIVALWDQSLETRMFPYLIAALLVVVGASMLVGAVTQVGFKPQARGRGTSTPPGERLAKPSAAGILLLLAIAYVAAMDVIGFYLATLAFVAATSLSLGLRKIVAAAVAVGTTAGAWLLFDQAFSVPLP